MKKTVIVKLIVVGILILSLIGCGATKPQTASQGQTAPVYKANDVIKIIVPFAAGGGYDRIARLLQPYFQDAIKEATGVPVTIIVENVTGAGGVLGYNQMSRAPGDGKTLGIVGMAAAPYQQLSSGQFDLNKFVAIGQLNTDPEVILVSGKSPFNNLNDLIQRSQQKSILFATEGKGSSGNIDPLITQAILDENGQKLKMDFVHYDGASTAMLAVVKGEAEAYMPSESTGASLIKSGDLKAIAIYSNQRGQYAKDAPTLKEQNIKAADQLSSVIGMTRIMIASPGTPDNITKVLRDALNKALTNKEFLDKAKTANIPIAYGSADVVKKNIDSRMQVADKYKDIVLPLMK